MNPAAAEKKVLFLSHSFFAFEAEVLSHYLNTLARELSQRGWKIKIVLPHSKSLAAEESIGPVKISRFRYFFERWETLAYVGDMAERVKKSWFYKIMFLFFLTAFFFKTRKEVKREKPACIHAHWWIPAGLVAYWHSFLSKIPYTVTLHGTDSILLQQSGFLRRRAAKILKRATKVTVVSNFLRAELLSLFPALENKTVVIPMPIDPEVLQREPKAARLDRFILCPARLIEQKNLSNLIEAFSQIAPEFPEVKLVIVGNGPKERELKAQAEGPVLSGRLEFIPSMPPPNLGSLYQAAEIVTLVSKNEGFGLVLVEAFLFKKPVVAARFGGITDIVSDGENGLLADPERPAEIAAAIKKLLSDATLRKKYGENGYQIYLQKFSPEKLTEKFEKVYSEIISR